MRFTIITVLFLTLTLSAPNVEAFRCGTHQLKKDMVIQTTSEAPTAPLGLQAPALPVGFQRTFFAIDFAKKQQHTINTTLRASGENCYIFVENAEWQKTVTQQTLLTIQTAFDVATPADPRRGIYEILTEDLGTPPDIDENQKVILLLLNIRDIDANHTTAGYFLPIDQQRGRLHHPTFGPLHSNEADILYIDVQNHQANPNTINAVIAHELQHLIHWQYSPNEETWIDEGCADYAAFHCGYNLNQHLIAFQKTPQISLTDWTQMSQINLLAHYGASFLFMQYLHEQYGGIKTIAEVVKNPVNGILGITRTLNARGFPRPFSEVYSDWKVANYLTSWKTLGTLKNPYRYNTSIPTIKPVFTHNTYPVDGKNKKLANFAAHAIECKGASPNQTGLTISFSTQRNRTANIKVAYLHNTGEIQVESLPFSTIEGIASVDVPDFGSTIQRIMFIPSLQIENPSFSQIFVNYNYNAYEGSLGTYNTHILPNPIHPNYWEIIAIPSGAKGIHSFTLTLTYQNSKILDAKPMNYIENNNNILYRCVFHLKPEIAPSDVEWNITRGDIIIDQGVLTKPITKD